MKATILFTAFLFLSLAAYAQKENKKWTVGLKTGFVTEFNSTRTMHLNANNGNVAQTSIHNQLFANKSFGKKQQWMLEASVAYFSNTRAESNPFFQQDPFESYYWKFKKDNIDFQLSGRYRIYQMKALKWSHYVGISANPIKTFFTTQASYLDDDKIKRITQDEDQSWRLYFGIEYFGKINLNNRISIQYNLNYAHSNPKFDMTSGLVRSRFNSLNNVNVGFGLGWGF